MAPQHCNNQCIHNLGLDVMGWGVCLVVGRLGGRCQGDVGGGYHGNKKTLQVMVGEGGSRKGGLGVTGSELED